VPPLSHFLNPRAGCAAYSARMTNSPNLARPTLLLAAFLSAVGYGLLLPVLPFIVAHYVPDPARLPLVLGWLTAVYALCSFVAAPVLGALSDAYGRRPVLLLCLLGTVIGYLIFGIGGSLWVLFLGRIIDGITAGDIAALFGYLADTTPAEDRGRVFGQVGAVFGAGFIAGPAIGGLASHLGLGAPLFIAAGVVALNLLLALFFLPESLPREKRSPFSVTHLNPFAQIVGVLSVPPIRRLLTVSVLFSLPFVFLQTLLGLLARDSLGWGAAQVSTAFIVTGVCDIVAQGVLLPRLLKWLGDRGVALLGLGLAALGLTGLALLLVLPAPALLYVSVVAFACGEGIFTASIGGLLSGMTPADAQGRVQGGAQALGSLTQIAGPFLGASLYARGGAWPFGVGAALVLLAGGLLGPGQKAVPVQAAE
jgi:MFS transporter, DHA1 family, tetracycline resistance protein